MLSEMMNPAGEHLEVPALVPKNSDPLEIQSVCFEVNVAYRINGSVLREIDGLSNCSVATLKS
jgi:hypothetical protein